MYRPLVYFWIVHYKSHLVVPQFTPDGTEVHFGDIPKGDVVKIGWYPFSVKMYHKLREKGILVIPSVRPFYELPVIDGYFCIYRRCSIQYGTRGIRWMPTVYVLENSKERMEITEEGVCKVVPNEIRE